MNFEKFNDEVFYGGENIIKVNKMDIAQLKQSAHQTPRQRSRLCTHKDIESSVHEMLIVHEKDIYIRPHKHPGKSESFHVIEGEADIVIFNDHGAISDLIEMSDYLGEKAFYYRLSEPLFHTMIIKSTIIVFHEATQGPFRREDTVFAEWSPQENEAVATRLFLKNLGCQVAAFTRG